MLQENAVLYENSKCRCTKTGYEGPHDVLGNIGRQVLLYIIFSFQRRRTMDRTMSRDLPLPETGLSRTIHFTPRSTLFELPARRLQSLARPSTQSSTAPFGFQTLCVWMVHPGPAPRYYSISILILLLLFRITSPI